MSREGLGSTSLTQRKKKRLTVAKRTTFNGVEQLRVFLTEEPLSK